MYLVLFFLVLRDLIVSVPDHCLSFLLWDSNPHVCNARLCRRIGTGSNLMCVMIS